MNSRCSHCGAELGSDFNCQERFNLCLALEFEQPAFGEVHHLTVLCYMLQHNRYSRRGRLEAVQLLVDFIEGGRLPSEVIRQNRSALDSGKRTWRFGKGEMPETIEQAAWTRTIADICLEDPDRYCADVKHWAKCVLRDVREHDAVMGEGPIEDTRRD